MGIDDKLLDELTERAKQSPRLRANYDLRNTPEDNSQRMLNALEPGTVVPVHRHTKSSETVAILRGAVKTLFYNDEGQLTHNEIVKAGSSCPFYFVPLGAWHTVECLESGTILFETKDGAFEPTKEEDILEVE